MFFKAKLHANGRVEEVMVLPTTFKQEGLKFVPT
jgi:hypothetical protein